MNGYSPFPESEGNKMEKGSLNRMEPIRSTRLKMNDYAKHVFADEKKIDEMMDILREDYGFTNEMLWRIFSNLHEKKSGKG